MLYFIEVLPYDRKYSVEKHSIYWNREYYDKYKEICYIKLPYIFNENIKAKENDYIITTTTESILLRN